MMRWSRSARRARTFTTQPKALLRLETLEQRALPSIDLTAFDQIFTGSRRGDEFRTGSGTQVVFGNNGNDRFLSLADAGEPDPAQTGGRGRVTPAVPADAAKDVFLGGAGADTFEFVPLLNGNAEVLDQYRSHTSGQVNWEGVAGENGAVHRHWVDGFGTDTILDYNRAEGDVIKVTGHTVSLASVEYGSDSMGTFTLVRIKSDQGANGGAHNGDALGTIKIYGDRVTAADVTLDANPHYGIERLNEANRLAANNGGGAREIISATNGDTFTGNGRVTDLVTLGRGSQTINAGAGGDQFVVYGDGGEPDPAQGGSRVNPPVDSALSNDVVRGGQGEDDFVFKLMLNAKPNIIAKHTRRDGSVNWRGVAGENGAVHNHWVESLGNDTLLNFDKADNDEIRIEGHTVAIKAIEYGSDAGGSYSLIRLKSDQGGAGAHNGDLLGTIKVYGDKVTAADITINDEVYHGINQLKVVDDTDNHIGRANGMYGKPSSAFQDYVPDTNATNVFTGSERGETFRTGAGTQKVEGGRGNDRIVSLADGGEPDPAQGGNRYGPPVPAGRADDLFLGGLGADTFEFQPLLNARPEVLDQFRSHSSGLVNWEGVAGENGAVHLHWVEGFGNDTVLDYSKAEGDVLKVAGHTVSLAGIDYGTDSGGAYSLIRIKSDQGANGGAHNGDLLGTIKVYGDRVTAADVVLDAAPHYGMERLREADRLASSNGGGTRVVTLKTDGAAYTSSARVSDLVTLGRGSQTVDTWAGNDKIVAYGDGGEPDPAQGGNRVNPPVDPALARDVIRGGLGQDEFVFRLLLNAKPEIIAKHTRRDGTVNWRGVAGENGAVHNHWVESLGNDTILDFDKDQCDTIRIEGHTVAIAGIDYGSDAGGSYSLIRLKSDQGGAGAHNGDLLGTIKVYGDKVTECDIAINAEVHYGIERLNNL